MGKIDLITPDFYLLCNKIIENAVNIVYATATGVYDHETFKAELIINISKCLSVCGLLFFFIKPS